ncbi:head-tail joining protein [Hahella ganghwensis]|uniref:head-tail joining protein n=1 Tax=Hahella ganghwensis TaxID=286420 RepID=UPI00037C7FCD|nr:hypothetical protein [Hahella ganghwensis]
MASLFDRVISKALEPAFNKVFGEDAVFNGTSLVQASLSRDVERTNQYGEVYRVDYEISVFKEQVGTVTKGDKFQLSDGTFQVVSILSDDGHRIYLEVLLV